MTQKLPQLDPSAIEAAFGHVRDVEWSEDRLRRGRRGMVRKRRVKQVRRVAGGAFVVAAAVLLAMKIAPALTTSQATIAEAPVEAPTDDLTFADGSRVTPLVPGTRVHVQDVSEGRVEVGLDSGGARFEVTPGQDRRFVVQAGDVSVVVLGTVFEVHRSEDQGTRVQVDRGVVRVEWASGHQILRRGQGGAFPPVEEVASVETTRTRTRSRARPRWRRLAEDGDYEAAFAELDNVRSAEELWLAADVARRAGHPADAVPYLEQLLRRFPRGRRAQNAAFTLGRVLSGLGRPAEAADAYDKAISGGGRLAESALFRRAQALQSAGRTSEARQSAERYQQRYPDGRYLGRLEGLLSH
ncbi:MAG: FecR domain-containing protein [Myxococcota bacterium]